MPIGSRSVNRVPIKSNDTLWAELVDIVRVMKDGGEVEVVLPYIPGKKPNPATMSDYLRKKGYPVVVEITDPDKNPPVAYIRKF